MLADAFVGHLSSGVGLPVHEVRTGKDSEHTSRQENPVPSVSMARPPVLPARPGTHAPGLHSLGSCFWKDASDTLSCSVPCTVPGFSSG